MPNKSRKSTHLLKLLLVGLGGLGLGTTHKAAPKTEDKRQTEQETKNFTVAHKPQVNVETFDGVITVHTWDKQEVKFTALKRAQDDAEMRGVSVRAEQSGSGVSIVAAFDDAFKREVNFYGNRVLSFSASVDLEIYLPREVSLVARTSDGSITVESLTGEADLFTKDGPIQVSGGQGSLKVKTDDGSIIVDNFTGAAEVHTGDGVIKLSGRFAQLNAATEKGSISLKFPSDFNATIETNSKSVHNGNGVVVAEGPASAQTQIRRWRAGAGGNLLTVRADCGGISFRR
ncbi:MAG TPA: DUF4097 family beta strand repeat-containing protein [Pyrinomonadaceae bacterium]|nr:DUF4097 family beta strand repeat-containing protein [Pyrinomonadaceae bacterium]